MSSSRRSCREADEILNGEIVSCVSRLRVRDPMSIDDFVCNPNEGGIEMESLTSEELLSEDADMPFIETVGLRDANDAGSEEVSVPLATQQSVDAERHVIFLLSDHPDLDDKLMKDLRKLQTRVREQHRCEHEEKIAQTSITSFFQAQ